MYRPLSRGYLAVIGCFWVTGPVKRKAWVFFEWEAADLVQKAEWDSTAGLRRFSTAIIKSVRHSTSYFLPTFPLIQTQLSHHAFWSNSTTGWCFHSTTNCYSLFFFIIIYFFMKGIPCSAAPTNWVEYFFFFPTIGNNRARLHSLNFHAIILQSPSCFKKSPSWDNGTSGVFEKEEVVQAERKEPGRRAWWKSGGWEEWGGGG